MTVVSCERSQKREPGCYQHHRLTEHTVLLWRNGMSARLCTALADSEQRQSAERRLLDNVRRNPMTGCWEWQRCCNHAGYGKMFVGGSTVDGTHRVSYQLFCGDVVAGLYVCHRCDNPRCVNPTHLSLGTPQENQQDMRAKGRARNLRGDDFPASKLTSSQVAEIRRQWRAGRLRKAIAAEFGVDPTTISRIASGGSWAHQPDTASRRSLPKLTPAQVSEAAAMVAAGESYQAVSERFSVSRMTVYRSVAKLRREERHESPG